jgi:hypothetical protein
MERLNVTHHWVHVKGTEMKVLHFSICQPGSFLNDHYTYLRLCIERNYTQAAARIELVSLGSLVNMIGYAN